MASRKLQDLCPYMRNLAEQFVARCADRGIRVLITQTWRSPKEQDDLYAQGRTMPGKKVTNAKAGQSAHNCLMPDGLPGSRAFDFAIYKSNSSVIDWTPFDTDDDRWHEAIEIGKKLGLVSGSTFHGIADTCHFEQPGWRTTDLIA
jgi:peptidoglycan L-alanyl-D-glutamate endopeptidase CwlK